MKKLILALFILPNFISAESISVDLICKGESDIYCEDLKKCGVESVTENIKISGSTLVHRSHGNHFLRVNDDTVSIKELDTDGSIGFSFNINRKTGEIEIIRSWGTPYHFTGLCELIRHQPLE